MWVPPISLLSRSFFLSLSYIFSLSLPLHLSLSTTRLYLCGGFLLWRTTPPVVVCHPGWGQTEMDEVIGSQSGSCSLGHTIAPKQLHRKTNTKAFLLGRLLAVFWLFPSICCIINRTLLSARALCLCCHTTVQHPSLLPATSGGRGTAPHSRDPLKVSGHL